MPRKKLEKTYLFPYHIVARSNNKEWFYLPTERCWEHFCSALTEISYRFQFQIHAFVLMNNHYHLVGTPSENFEISKLMEWFQRSVNRRINDEAGRINHLFGGPYKACLIESPKYYFHALKYVYLNPVNGGIALRAEDYRFSTLNDSRIPMSWPITGIDALVPRSKSVFLEMVNQRYSQSDYDVLQKAFRKTKFEIGSRILRKNMRSLNL